MHRQKERPSAEAEDQEQSLVGIWYTQTVATIPRGRKRTSSRESTGSLQCDRERFLLTRRSVYEETSLRGQIHHQISLRTGHYELSAEHRHEALQIACFGDRSKLRELLGHLRYTAPTGNHIDIEAERIRANADPATTAAYKRRVTK